MRSTINKIYVSHFLIGLVFWYGIEKLFMAQIGIDAVGFSFIAAMFLLFNLIFDIPSGILADRWSRKGLLAIAAIAMALGSISIGVSNGIGLFLLGYIFYGVYVVGTSGTYQAIIYDTLHETGQSKDYSRVNGRAEALFLAGVGVANISSGFIANHFGFRSTFFVSVIPCVLNLIVIMSIKEPTFHKAEQKEKMLPQITAVSKTIMKLQLLRALVFVFSGLTVIELFKSEYGQFYFLRYTSSAVVLGLLWAVYSFGWSLGSLIAHRLHARLTLLVLGSTIPYILMAIFDNRFSIIFFMIQSVASAALYNQIETKIQDETPSAVRASVLSVLGAVERLVSIPSAFLIGWIIRDYGAFWAVRAVATAAVIMLFYWLYKSAQTRRLAEPVAV